MNSVMATIHGARAARTVMKDIEGGHADSDAVFSTLKYLLAINDIERLRAFCRELQKCLERDA